MAGVWLRQLCSTDTLLAGAGTHTEWRRHQAGPQRRRSRRRPPAPHWISRPGPAACQRSTGRERAAQARCRALPPVGTQCKVAPARRLAGSALGLALHVRVSSDDKSGRRRQPAGHQRASVTCISGRWQARCKATGSRASRRCAGPKKGPKELAIE